MDIKIEKQINTTVPTSVASDKNESNAAFATRGKPIPKPYDEFHKELYQFHERRGTPITHVPKITGRIIDLHRLYSEVTERGGFLKVNVRDEWEEVVAAVMGFRQKCLNATAAIKQIYRRFLDKYERMTYFGEDPDKIEAIEASDALESSRSGRSRYPSLLHGSSSSNASNIFSAVPMSYNYRQHTVNSERRRLNKMSTDLYKASPYDKLMLSLISPLPNEQDFAINVCTLMSNESKHTLKLNECPKLLDILLAHTGIFADYTLRKFFQHIYADVRENSLLSFWRDLLYDKPQYLELYTDEQILREALLVEGGGGDMDFDFLKSNILQQQEEYLADDFFNLKRGEGTQDYIGQRVQQIISILRNLTFFEENMQVFARNRTFLRFIVMASNVRWGNTHIQALDMGGNIATELELLDPTIDDLSRGLIATICDGIEGMDRAVILNCLEILYKICQKDGNEDYINKCLNLKFYETICHFLSLNDIMLLIYTLEAIYALTSMGARPCQLIMQVRGIIDQLVALITVEAQSYGPDGCILMRVVETVPGNMLPMVAQNIANLQNVAVKQQILGQSQSATTPQQSIAPQQPTIATEISQNAIPTKTTATEIQPSPSQNHCGDATKVGTATAAVQSSSSSSNQQQATQQSTTIPSPSPQVTLQMPTNYTHEDEQYAMAWLGATFERATTNESRVEQQELYRMYLTHCQKSGKHSVVNHLQFPRLVRLIYNQSVGPLVVRGSDGLDLPGFHYVGIRIRAQPLPIQSKAIVATSSAGKPTTTENNTSAPRRIKKKLKPQNIPTSDQSNDASSLSGNDGGNQDTIVAKVVRLPDPVSNDTSIANEVHIPGGGGGDKTPVAANTIYFSDESATDAQNQQNQPQKSLIKSLLANKVTQRQQKQKELVANPNSVTPQQSSTPIKVASTAISALVNNPLMQNTAVKVGQTTIKPLSLSQHIDKKPLLDSTPPPLAPLSGNNVIKDTSGRPIIISTSSTHPLDPSQIPTNIIKRKIEEDPTPPPPPLTTKRLALDETLVTPSKSAANLYAEIAASILEDEDMDDITVPTITTTTATLSTTTQRTNISEHQPQQQQLVRIQKPPPTVSIATIQQQPVTLTNTIARQLIFHQTSSQLKSAHMPGPSQQQQQIPTAMATIKTEQGLQTVPVILQQKPLDAQHMLQTANLIPQATTTQYVLATNPQGQTYLVAQQTPTAAAQPLPPTPTPPPPPPPQSTQTVLVTQTPQQQSTGAKTIIILQQPLQGSVATAGTTTGTQQQQIITTAGGGVAQKMIMTTLQGQQVLVTRPTMAAGAAPTTQQIFINAQTGAATHIQHVPCTAATTAALTNPTFQRQIIQTAVTQHQQQQAQTGQISPTLLSQLNHIPATIKLHQPLPQQPQPATISRINKPISIVAAGQALPQQLQQHQSIIQQHIVSGGPNEKRQVILGGGSRAIEIKETIITQSAAPPTHQCQLNSQTIITTTQQQQSSNIATPQKPPPMQKLLRPATPTVATIQKITETPPLVSTASNVVHQHESIASWQIRQQQQQSKQQVKIQTAVSIAPKPSLIGVGGGPPPLVVVSNNNSHVVINAQQKPKPQLESALEQNKSNTTTATIVVGPSSSSSTLSTSSNSSSISSSLLNAESKTVIQQVITTSTNTVIATTSSSSSKPQHVALPHPSLPTVVIPPIDPNWLYICDWRNCPRRKYKSLLDLQYHVTSVHCPEHLDSGAEIFCQWGAGPGLCDGVPRKRFSLMTHLVDRHLLAENLRSACQRRLTNGTVNVQPTQPPVTIMRNVEKTQQTASPTPTSNSSNNNTMGFSALHAIKRHTVDFMNAKELMDENEGPVTKSIRLTAALVLRNLVTYTNTAKRILRRYEPHLSNIALSNVESSVTLSHILAELNN